MWWEHTPGTPPPPPAELVDFNPAAQPDDRMGCVLRKEGWVRGRRGWEVGTWERRRLVSTVREPSDRAFLAMLDPAVMAPGPELAERLHAHFVKRTVPAFFAGVRDGSSAQELGTVRWTAQRARLIAAADGILAGQFDLLGYRGLSFGDPIDWHFDPVAQKRAPRVHWSRIRYLDAEAMGDHKVIWELNRHQHLMVLGRAFQVTRHEEYARCFAAHVNSWMDENPPKTGVNWASSLEISYRAIAWLWAIELFRDARALTPALLRRMLTYLYLHGRGRRVTVGVNKHIC